MSTYIATTLLGTIFVYLIIGCVLLFTAGSIIAVTITAIKDWFSSKKETNTP